MQLFIYKGLAGGLNFRDQVDLMQADQSVEALNVVFGGIGSVRRRGGTASFSAADGTNRYDSLAPFYTSAGVRQLLAGAGTRLEALSATGTLVAAATGLSRGPYGFARFGSPAVETSYAGNGEDTLRKWDGTTWTAPTATVDAVAGRAMPRGSALALTADNRLAVVGFRTTTGGPNGATSSPSHIYFSEPGAPETFLSSNYLQLRPGDGERIEAIVAWREFVFVFKRSAFWVLYGTSSSATGVAIFQYRPVSTGIGAVSARAVAVGQDGVYFLGADGVYRTSGGEPQLVSQIIAPFFTEALLPLAAQSTLNPAALEQASMVMVRERLYVALATGADAVGSAMLVYDTRQNWWSLFDLHAAALVAFAPGTGIDELYFAASTGAQRVYRHAASLADDAGVAIRSLWRSSLSDLGVGVNKSVRQFELWGSGSLLASMDADYATGGQPETVDFGLSSSLWSDGSKPADLWSDGGGTDPWGDGARVKRALVRTAVRGSLLGLRFSDVGGVPWEIQRVVAHIRESGFQVRSTP